MNSLLLPRGAAVAIRATAVILLILWRTHERSVSALLHEWLFLISLWVILVFGNTTRLARDWSGLVAAVMAYLSGIYLQGQWRHMVDVWGFGP